MDQIPKCKVYQDFRRKYEKRASQYWKWLYCFGCDTSAMETKVKIDKLDCIKIKTSVSQMPH